MFNFIKKLFPTSNFTIDAKSAEALLQNGAKVIDVRTEQEYAKGHPEGTINIPLSKLPEATDQLPKEPLLLHCQGGVRSAKAVKILKQKGYKEVYNLGGIQEAYRVLEKK